MGWRSVSSTAGIGDGSSSNNSKDGALADVAVPFSRWLAGPARVDRILARCGSIGGPSADVPAFLPDAPPVVLADASVGVTPILTSIGITPPALTLVVGVPNSTLVVTAVYSDGTTKTSPARRHSLPPTRLSWQFRATPSPE